MNRLEGGGRLIRMTLTVDIPANDKGKMFRYHFISQKPGMESVPLALDSLHSLLS